MSTPSSSASASIVVTPGVSISTGASRDAGNSGGRGIARATSRSAAKSPFSHVTSVFSPEPDGARKSTDSVPPIIPDSASTAKNSIPHRSKIRSYAPQCKVKLAIEPLRVAVERVRVLHDELANPQQAAARPRLVAILRLKVVPGLGQLLVALQLARVERERLFVRERQDEPPARAILDIEDLRDPDAAGRLPQLGRGEHRSEPLLRTDRVELLTDDLLDLPVHPPAERRVRPDARAELPYEAAADEQLVAHGFGVGRSVAQRRQEEL